MKITNNILDQTVSETILDGGIAVLKTDTVYGIVALARREDSVEYIYDIKGRDLDKPFIVLIPDLSYIPGLTKVTIQEYNKHSSIRPTSMIIRATNQPNWLTRGSKGISYRVPYTNKKLIQLLKITGPLVAPSANPQGEKTASNIEEAIAYFGAKVDLYINGGNVPDSTQPSRLIELTDGDTRIIR